MSNDDVFSDEIQKVTDQIFKKFYKDVTAIPENFKDGEWYLYYC